MNKKEKLIVASKYPNFTKSYFKKINKEIDVIKLNGSVELAPLVGLSDVIVDICETGSTLKANGLKVLDSIQYISARLVSNKVSYRFKKQEIDKLVSSLEEIL